MSAPIAVFEANARVAPLKAVHRAWCFVHAGCAPTRFTLHGLSANPDPMLAAQLDQAASSAGLSRAEFSEPLLRDSASAELALVVEVHGCQAAKDAAFEFAAAICRYFPSASAGIRVQFNESAIGSARRLAPTARCAAAIVPGTAQGSVGTPRRRHAHSRLHA